MPWFSNNKSNLEYRLWLRPLHTAQKHHPTMFHKATVKPTISGPSILYNTPLRGWVAASMRCYYLLFNKVISLFLPIGVQLPSLSLKSYLPRWASVFACPHQKLPDLGMWTGAICNTDIRDNSIFTAYNQLIPLSKK